MIYKESLLEAYMTLSGSSIVHLAMLLTMFVILPEPFEISDDDDKAMLKRVYIVSLVTRGASFILKTSIQFGNMHKFKFTQVIEVVVVALNIYLTLDCSQVFAELKTEDILGGDNLNPTKNINRKRKQNLFASLPI